jgi:16S rRNA (guanine527-N7)-methyltransferase
MLVQVVGSPEFHLPLCFLIVIFHLVDSIGKKIKVVNEVAAAVGIENVYAEQLRAEQVKDKFDFVVSRAVTCLPEFMEWIKGKFLKTNSNDLPNGVLYLKGGDLTEELAPVKQKIKIYNLPDFFDEEFFETKKVVYVRM